jgi:hypothetical protein
MMPRRSIDYKTFYLDYDMEKPVYCLDFIQKNHYSTAIITEGPFDVLTAYSYGYPAIGTFGNPSDYQIDQINKSCITVLYTMFDNDDAGRKFTRLVKSKLDKRILVVEVKLPEGKKDINDLSFEEFEIEYKFLKAVIEGGMETKPDNVLIYATSNRRHLIRETWSDRSDMSNDELHRSDTMQEKLSLVARFGVTINYSKPTKKEFNNIVVELAKRYPEIQLTDEELMAKANMWEMSHGGVSGRTAQQFINYLAGKGEC